MTSAPRFVIGTDEAARHVSQSSGRGNRVRHVGQVQRVRAGTEHAVRVGETVALCGHEPLHRWPNTTFGSMGGGATLLCADCRAAIDAASPSLDDT